MKKIKSIENPLPNCPKCKEKLMTGRESFELWPAYVLDSRGIDYDYLCWNCNLGFQEKSIIKLTSEKRK